MTRLSEGAVDFARAHITRFYDSDFFPKAQDYEALWAQWTDVRGYLTTTNISKLLVALPFVLAAPKGRAGYRIVHQLDPLASIIYTALARDVVEKVEAARADEDVACSYRFKLDGEAFFAAGVGYDRFMRRCETLAGQFSHVLVLDIADFYNSIYLHRVANAVVS